jgi:hypothetical protein
MRASLNQSHCGSPPVLACKVSSGEVVSGLLGFVVRVLGPKTQKLDHAGTGAVVVGLRGFLIRVSGPETEDIDYVGEGEGGGRRASRITN